jgi:hypothetical protein
MNFNIALAALLYTWAVGIVWAAIHRVRKGKL